MGDSPRISLHYRICLGEKMCEKYATVIFLCTSITRTWLLQEKVPIRSIPPFRGGHGVTTIWVLRARVEMLRACWRFRNSPSLILCACTQIWNHGCIGWGKATVNLKNCKFKSNIMKYYYIIFIRRAMIIMWWHFCCNIWVTFATICSLLDDYHCYDFICEENPNTVQEKWAN